MSVVTAGVTLTCTCPPRQKAIYFGRVEYIEYVDPTCPVHRTIPCKSCGEPIEDASLNNVEHSKMDFQDADSGNVCVTCGRSLPW